MTAPELAEFLTSEDVVDARDAISSLEDLGLIYAADQGWRPAK